MDRINKMSDDLLIKILSFVRTKVAVSTSILSKRWEFLWMLVPNLEYDDCEDIHNQSIRVRSSYRNFLDKNLLLHRAPIIESLTLTILLGSVKPEDIKQWVGIAVSRCLRELIIDYDSCNYKPLPSVFLPSSFYSCKSPVALKLIEREILVDVPPTVCLPSLKTLQLLYVTYFSEDSLRVLLSHCPALEDLVIERDWDDNVKGLVVIVPSLQRLSLGMKNGCSSDEYVIDTPSLKYLKVEDYRCSSSYMIKHMPKLEEADIIVQKGLEQFLELITSVKRLSLKVLLNNEEESMYRAGIVFDQLEHLKLRIYSDYWSKLLVRLLNDSPKLRVLSVDYLPSWKHDQINWDIEGSLIPKCLLKTLETFKFEESFKFKKRKENLKFAGRKKTPEEKDFLSFILKNARRLKFTSIC